MLTVRVSPKEVQVGTLVYVFDDVGVADGFEASANIDQIADGQSAQRKGLAVRCRAVDCDHEVGWF